MIYLDNNATTLMDGEILTRYIDLLQNPTIANPHSSEHTFGWRAHHYIEDAMETIAEAYGLVSDNVVFTSGATEANNLAIFGTAETAYLSGSPRNRILVSSIEHKCVLNSAKHAQQLFGFIVETIPVDESGRVNLEALKSMLAEDVLIVSIMAVNNEIGVIQDLEAISGLVHSVGAIFHSDIAQAGYVEINAFDLEIDLLSVSAHKLYGPKGIGALLMDKSALSMLPSPILHGGGQQEGLRAGTLSPALCDAFAHAVTKMGQVRYEESHQLRLMCQALLARLDEAGINYQINGVIEHRHPGNLNLSIVGIDSRLLIARLADKVAISSGSACNSGVIERSYVLNALNLPDERINSAFRLCFGRNNRAEEVDLIAEHFIREIRYLQANV